MKQAWLGVVVALEPSCRHLEPRQQQQGSSSTELHVTPVTAAAAGATPQRGGAARPLCGTATGWRPQHGLVEEAATSTPP